MVAAISLMHVIDLAKLLEDKYSKIRKYQKPSNTYNIHIIILFFTCHNFRPLLPKPSNNIRVKKLIPSELQERREKGLFLRPKITRS